VHVTFARSVISDPDRVVALVSQQDGTFAGRVRLRLAGAVASSASGEASGQLTARVEVQPVDAAGALDIENEHVSTHEVDLSISCRREAVQGRRFGSLVIHHGIGTEPPVRLLWYVRSGPAN
jgi:hypothetical protein